MDMSDGNGVTSVKQVNTYTPPERTFVRSSVVKFDKLVFVRIIMDVIDSCLQ